MKINENIIWNLLRVLIAFIFLWTFFDKALGLGFATMPDKAWIHGVSPTAGFLQFGSKGLFAPIFHTLSGNLIIDLLFMMGLFLIGLSLIVGIGIRIACASGSLLLTLIYLSLFPPVNNPLLDEHIIYIIILFGILIRSSKQSFGLAKKWSSLSVVKRYPILV